MDKVQRFIVKQLKDMRFGARSAVLLFPESLALVRKNLNVYALLFALPAAISISNAITLYQHTKAVKWNWKDSISMTGSYSPQSSIKSYVGYLMLCISLGVIISSILVNIANVEAASGKTLKLKTLWHKFNSNWLWLRIIGIEIITAIAVILGLVLFVLPGVYLMTRLIFSSYVLIDGELALDRAISKSWKMSKGHFWEIFFLMVVALLLNAALIIPVAGPVVALVLTSAYAVATGIKYFEVKAKK